MLLWLAYFLARRAASTSSISNRWNSATFSRYCQVGCNPYRAPASTTTQSTIEISSGLQSSIVTERDVLALRGGPTDSNANCCLCRKGYENAHVSRRGCRTEYRKTI